MTLAIGARLGPYEVTAKLGEGGMGEVWRARDTKLEREVAIKVLPEAFVEDQERLARFEREAKLLAQLNHPNIAQIYGMEASGDAHALVMELVEGPTLADRLGSGPLPIDEALPLARQIAEALEEAHEKGIVHRDLKPQNIKASREGKLKVLDFGLAKAMEPAGGAPASPGDLARSPTLANSPTLTAVGTQLGVILGTAAYMSPEQARGAAVDKRSDIWAFGCVLFEMLTGRPPFTGETVTDLLAAVVRSEPDWSALPAATPPAIRRLLERCLRKDAKQRLRDIGDARLEIAEPIAQEPVESVAAAPAHGGRLVAAAAVLVLVALAAGFWWGRTLAPAAPRWTGEQLGGPDVAMLPRLSPDGQLLAFVTVEEGQSQVAVMKPGTATWTVLTHDKTQGIAYSLSWSRDGSRIYYDRFTDAALGIFSVPALGGEERLVLEHASFPAALPDGSLLAVRPNADREQQIHRFWPDTGKLESLPALLTDFGAGEWLPLMATPDGRRVVFGGWPADATDRPPELYVMDLESKAARPLAPGTELRTAVNLAQPTDSAVLFGTYQGDVFQLFRAGLDGGPAVPLFMLPQRATLDGAPDGSVLANLGERPVELLAMSPSGDSVEELPVVPAVTRYGLAPLPGGRYLVPSRIGDHERILVVERGRPPVPLLETSEDTRFPAAAIGPREAVVTIGPESSPDLAVVGTADGRIVRRFASPAPRMSSLDASPDGTTLYYAAAGSIWSTRADGDGTPSRLTAGDSVTVDPETGDLVVKINAEGRFQLVRLRRGESAPEPIVLTGDLRMTFRELLPGSVRGGRLVLSAASADSWYYHVAKLDLATGELRTVLRGDPYDFQIATWGSAGEVVGLSSAQRETLWRFRPVRD